MKKLDKNEYAPFFQPYIQALINNNKDVVENLENSFRQAEELLSNIDSEKQTYQYAHGKWTIKEIVQHLIDTERILIEKNSSRLCLEVSEFTSPWERSKLLFRSFG